MVFDAVDFRLIEHEAVFDLTPFLLDPFGESLDAEFFEKDFDARFVFVVSTTIQVVHAQNGFKVR